MLEGAMYPTFHWTRGGPSCMHHCILWLFRVLQVPSLSQSEDGSSSKFMELRMPSLQTPFFSRPTFCGVDHSITPLLARCSHSKIGSKHSLAPRPWASDSDPDAAVDANLNYSFNVIQSIIIRPGGFAGDGRGRSSFVRSYATLLLLTTCA